MTTKILGNQIEPFTIETTQLSNTAVTSLTVALPPKVLYANVASNTFTVLDDTAVNVGGGYIVVTGSNFVSGATVLIDTTTASAVTYVNSTTLQVQVPTKSAASYNLYVVNPDGGVGIKVSGLTYSTDPAWVTTSPLDNQESNTAFGINFSATGATSYSVAAGSTLPAGTSLLANGYFYGTVSIGSQTTYSFVIRATDAELQDADKTFGVTVTVTPVGRLFSWGKNLEGQLGLNNTAYRSSPTQVGAGTDWKNVSSEEYQTVGIKSNGTLWTWGINADGQLGINNTVNRSSPTQVGSDTNWNLISTGAFAVAAIKTTGTLWTWGRGTNGQLGQNNAANASSPVQVGFGTDWSKVSMGKYFCAAIKTNGTLWTWGIQTPYGVLGQNNTGNKSSPIQVGADTNWSLVSSGLYSILATKTNGTLWSWGMNSFGQLGQNNTTNASSPVQVGSDTTWSSISTQQYDSLAIKTNGSLWGWGRNMRGQLGQNDTTYKSSPVQIGTDTNWSFASVGYYASLAVRTNGTLWSMGRNYEGQLGQNNTTYRSSPTQVGAGTTWIIIAAGQENAFAIAT